MLVLVALVVSTSGPIREVGPCHLKRLGCPYQFVASGLYQSDEVPGGFQAKEGAGPWSNRAAVDAIEIDDRVKQVRLACPGDPTGGWGMLLCKHWESWLDATWRRQRHIGRGLWHRSRAVVR